MHTSMFIRISVAFAFVICSFGGTSQKNNLPTNKNVSHTDIGMTSVREALTKTLKALEQIRLRKRKLTAEKERRRIEAGEALKQTRSYQNAAGEALKAFRESPAYALPSASASSGRRLHFATEQERGSIEDPWYVPEDTDAIKVVPSPVYSEISSVSFGTNASDDVVYVPNPKLQQPTKERSASRIAKLKTAFHRSNALLNRSKVVKKLLKADKTAKAAETREALKAFPKTPASTSSGRRLQFSTSQKRRSIEDPWYRVPNDTDSIKIVPSPVLNTAITSSGLTGISKQLYERKARELFVRLGQYVLLAWIGNEASSVFEEYFSATPPALADEFPEILTQLKVFYNTKETDEIEKIIHTLLANVNTNVEAVTQSVKEFNGLNTAQKLKFNLGYANFKLQLAALDKNLVDVASKVLLTCEITKIVSLYVALRDAGMLSEKSDIIEHILKSGEYKSASTVTLIPLALRSVRGTSGDTPDFSAPHTETSLYVINTEVLKSEPERCNDYSLIASTFSASFRESVNSVVIQTTRPVCNSLFPRCVPWMKKVVSKWGVNAGFSVRLALKLARFRYHEKDKSEQSRCDNPDAIDALLYDNKIQPDLLRLPDDVLTELTDSRMTTESIYKLYRLRQKLKLVLLLTSILSDLKDEPPVMVLLQSMAITPELKAGLQDMQNSIKDWLECTKAESTLQQIEQGITHLPYHTKI